jgi:hypothetical protein
VVHRRAELDLDGQDPLALDNQQIDFGSGLCPPEEGLGTDQAVRGQGGELFDHHPFERSAPLGPRSQLLRTA